MRALDPQALGAVHLDLGHVAEINDLLEVAATGPGYCLRVVDGSSLNKQTHMNTPSAAAGFSPSRRGTDARRSPPTQQIDRYARP